jgi:Pilus formation protein N terminal region
MMNNAGKLMIVAVALFSTASWAAPLALWVGQTSFLGFPSRGAKVEVSNDAVVEVQITKSGMEIIAKQPGVSQVSLKLRDGEAHTFAVHVTPSGAEVYTVNRTESEHAAFSLSPSPVVKKSIPAVAEKAAKGKAGKNTVKTAEYYLKAIRPSA